MSIPVFFLSLFSCILLFFFIFRAAAWDPAAFRMKVRFTAIFKMAAVSLDPNHRRESPLPTVNERLGHLKPSRELLEYYRRKIAEYDGEYEEMVRKLELYKCTYEEQVINRSLRPYVASQFVNSLCPRYLNLLNFSGTFSIKPSGNCDSEKKKSLNCRKL